MIKADFHMHCAASEDSEIPIETLCQAAVRQGLSMIAVTDHVELVDYHKGEYDKAYTMSWEMMSQAEVPDGLRLAKGIELGEPCFDIALAERLLSAHPYDFVLGSQHRLSDALPDYYFIDYSEWSDEDIIAEMRRYFEEVRRMVQWNGFDSLAHLTYPFRYLPPKWRNGDYSPWQDVLDDLLSTLAANGKALEINTSGIRKGQGMTSPDYPLIKRFYELGGRRVTVGSDAHRENEVGADLEEAIRLAAKAGFRAITVYFDRQPLELAIDSYTDKANGGT